MIPRHWPRGLPPGRRPWSKGEQLKLELALAYVAHRVMAHAGEPEPRQAVKDRRDAWRRLA